MTDAGCSTAGQVCVCGGGLTQDALLQSVGLAWCRPAANTRRWRVRSGSQSRAVWGAVGAATSAGHPMGKGRPAIAQHRVPMLLAPLPFPLHVCLVAHLLFGFV